jgi:hypothetical protein
MQEPAKILLDLLTINEKLFAKENGKKQALIVLFLQLK